MTYLLMVIARILNIDTPSKPYLNTIKSNFIISNLITAGIFQK